MANDKGTLEPSQQVENLTSDERTTWLKTGELPSQEPPVEEPKAEVPPVEAEPQPEPEPEQPKQAAAKEKKPNQMGYGELRRELTEANRRIAELMARADAATSSGAPAQSDKPTTTSEPKEAKAESRSKPTPADKDEKGNPKYKTYEDYLEDLTDWKTEQRFAAYQKEQTEKAEQAKVAQAQEQVAEKWRGQVDAARAKHADFDDVALNPNLPIPQGSVVEQWILSSDIGTEILYHLAGNPDELKALHAMRPVEAARALVVLEANLTEPDEPKSEPPAAPAAKRVTEAPPPVTEVGHRQKATEVDPAAQALQEGDFERYRREMNAKEIRAKKGAR